MIYNEKNLPPHYINVGWMITLVGNHLKQVDDFKYLGACN